MTGVEHFVDGNTSNTDYLYDNSGNLKQDLNKGISSIVYNHLNKPTLVTFSNGKKIQYIYDAAGQKLRQKVFGNGGSATTVETDYVGPFHYEDSDGDGSSATTAIQFFSHEEGRVRRAGSELIYESFLKDHLGNVRVMFADMNGDGAVSPDPVNGEVLQVDHFYPFGLRMAGLSLVPGVKNSYLFTGKEAQDELGLGWIDFGARMYDAASSRWNGVDAMAERYLSHSPYVYTFNNPIVFVDPDGREITTAQLIANAWAATPEGGSATFSFGNANSSEQENTEERNLEGMGNDFSVGMTNPEKSEIGEDLGNKELQMKHNRNGQKTNPLAAWPPLKFIRFLLDQLGATNHRNTWTEKDANQWSYWLHGRPNNWNFQSFPVYVK